MKKNNVLCLFIKAPIQGYVKTRLQPYLNPEDSRFLYCAMVEDMVARFKNNLLYDLVIFYWPHNQFSIIQNWLGMSFKYVSQNGNDLGLKMYNAICWSVENGYKKTILIGSDIPTLNLATIEKGFLKLKDHDVVIGPSNDGGYYLMGLKEPVPVLFHDIHWSTDIVLKETVDKINLVNLNAYFLPRELDIDRIQDVINLRSILMNIRNKDHCSIPLNTRKVLNSLFFNKILVNKNER
jgi:rSAM/selenodomain-associated transferase 1